MGRKTPSNGEPWDIDCFLEEKRPGSSETRPHPELEYLFTPFYASIRQAGGYGFLEAMLHDRGYNAGSWVGALYCALLSYAAGPGTAAVQRRNPGKTVWWQPPECPDVLFGHTWIED